MNESAHRSILKNSEKPAPAGVGSVGVLGRVEGLRGPKESQFFVFKKINCHFRMEVI